MNSIHLTDAELEMARHGMTAYLRSFGHDEADTLALIKSVIAKLSAAPPVPITESRTELRSRSNVFASVWISF